jgi:FtsP/CotA-like multicopper oxidase with cupredoxin domain
MTHPVHLHRNTFELRTLDAAIPGYKDTGGKASAPAPPAS